MGLSYGSIDVNLPLTFNNTHHLSGVRKQEYAHRPQILANVEHQWSVGIVVNKSAGTTVGNRTIVKAGTPLTGDINNRTTAFTKATSSAVGVLLHDVDVTDGNNNGTLLMFGFVNTNRLDSDVKTLLTDTLKDTMNMIKFLDC